MMSATPPVPAPASQRRGSLLRYVYNHNPFYAVSASLMLFAVLRAYGHLQIGAINTWLMMGVLAGYTSILAVIGVLIVRWGKVWEDARSILLVLMLLFLALSVCADDIFARTKTTTGGTLLLLCGYIFSAVVTEAVLHGARIRIGMRYRIPYHLMMALFYAVPWWCSPRFNMLTTAQTEWTLFLFPAVAGLLFLALLPAVRRGPEYVEKNGTPWRWPWFPWCAFGLLAIAFCFRSFALCMVFGPKGPIWKQPDKRIGIVFDTIWNFYFLVPLAFSILLLILETALVNRNRRLQQRVLALAPLLLALCLPWFHGPVRDGFLATVTRTIGSPVWLTAALLVVFYAWAWLRRAPEAVFGVVASMLLFSVVGPKTVDFQSLLEPRPVPLFIASLVMLGAGLWTKSGQKCVLAAILAAPAIWLALTDSPLTGFRYTISYHFLWLSILAVGLVFHDSFARLMRFVGAVQMPIAALMSVLGARPADVPVSWRLAYVGALAALSFVIAKVWRDRVFLQAFSATCGIAGYGATTIGFRRLVELFGREAMSAFSWSVAALLLAFLISAHKAKWIPKRLIPRWPAGNGSAANALDKGPPVNGGTTEQSP